MLQPKIQIHYLFSVGNHRSFPSKAIGANLRQKRGIRTHCFRKQFLEGIRIRNENGLKGFWIRSKRKNPVSQINYSLRENGDSEISETGGS